MPTPLFDALRSHLSAGRESFHTPGHKGRAELLRGLDARFDLTELPGTDSLYHADGPILEAERLAARLFSADRTVFSAGGCTLAIQAMLRLATEGIREPEVLFQRNGLHQSAVNAMALLDICPRYMFGELTADSVEAGITGNTVAVYITSPNYYGQFSDIPAIADICRRHNIPLLVDNAHGTHLVAFGLHPLSLGASLTACSAHKTLPVLTGGAFLSCSDAKYSDHMKAAMALFGSTSPSYPVMASLDLARDWMEREGAAAFRRLAAEVAQLRDLAREKGFGIPSGQCDPVRLTLLPREIGLTGVQAAAFLRGAGCEPEYADESAVVLIITPFNSGGGLKKLRSAIEAMPVSRPLPRLHPPVVMPRAALPPREAAFAPGERVPVGQAVGRIAGEAVCPCPPGVPIAVPGEIIDSNMKEILELSGIRKIKVLY